MGGSKKNRKSLGKTVWAGQKKNRLESPSERRYGRVKKKNENEK